MVVWEWKAKVKGLVNNKVQVKVGIQADKINLANYNSLVGRSLRDAFKEDSPFLVM